MAELSSLSTPSPETPSSPTSPATFISHGSTVVGTDLKRDGPDSAGDEQQTSDVKFNDQGAAGPERVEFDVESLESRSTKQRTFSDYITRVKKILSNRLPDIPTHWRHNYLNKTRNSQRIDDHPMGYPRFAAYLNSDDNFLIARRYGVLHTRVMLYRQDELYQLEKDLYELDKEDAVNEPLALESRKRDDRREGQERKQLIAEIDQKLKEYGKQLAISLSWL